MCSSDLDGRHSKTSIFGLETPENMFAQRYLPQHDVRYLALHVKGGVLVGVEFDDGSSDVAETKLAEKLVQVEAANPGLHVDSMGRNDLIIALKAKGLKGNGTTSELAARLKAAL